MPATFSRTMRSLDRDHFRPTLLGIAVVLFLLAAWTVWFFGAELTLYEVSKAARIVDGRRVIAEFPVAEGLGRIRPGQRATLRLDAFSWVQYGTLSAEVSRVRTDAESGTLSVELLLEDVERFPVEIEPGWTGELEVEVERISPAALVLRAAGRSAERDAPRRGP